VNDEIDTLLAVLQRRDRDGRFEEQLRLTRALSRLLAVALRWLDLLRSLRQLLAAAERHGDANAKAWALHELGTLHLAAGNIARADQALGEARELRKELGDSRGLAATDRNLQVLCQALRQLMREGRLVERRGIRKSLPAPVAVLATILVLAIGGATAAIAGGLLGGSSHQSSPTAISPTPISPTAILLVPNVLNHPAQVASATLRHAGFVPSTGTPQSSDTVPSGDVISTDPAAGTKADKGSTVTMVVSTGLPTPGPVAIPDVTGLSESVASNTLTNAGFVPRTGTPQSSDTVPSGDVISTDPAAGTKADKGSTVTMVVSTGLPTPGPVAIPDVTGLSESVASNTLTNAGFVSSTGTPQCSDTVPSGDVISTAPAAGAPAAKGSTVTMAVSIGSCPR
jgi:beta-lactam-binding protein with PASTA domain